MPTFRTSDPFPLVDSLNIKQSESFAHAEACDHWLGLQIHRIERQLAANGCRSRAKGGEREKQQIWLGLDPQMLLTPYTELRGWLERLRPRPGQTIVDLGAAYGRMGFVLSRHFPQANFIGFEYVGERVHEGNRALSRFGAFQARIEHVDLSSPTFTPPLADYYFLYDFGTPKAIEKILYDLRRLGPITVIARGRHSRYLIDRSHGWLKNAFPDEPEGRITVYQSGLLDVSVRAVSPATI